MLFDRRSRRDQQLYTGEDDIAAIESHISHLIVSYNDAIARDETDKAAIISSLLVRADDDLYEAKQKARVFSSHYNMVRPVNSVSEIIIQQP